MSGDKLFTREIRIATRDVHYISDRLINAKLAFALSNDRVWADGLLVFYEVFRYLDAAMARLSDTLVGQLCIDGMRRTEAFEQDLDYYNEIGWKIKYKPRESVTNYLKHLEKIENEDPNLLMAYIYHLYMGLLSGGQILKKKRELFKFMGNVSCRGNAVTDFGDSQIYKLKQELAAAMNNIALNLDKDTKDKLIKESKTVFLLNNDLIKSVEGTNQVVVRKVVIGALIVIPIAWLIFKLYF